jgi:hypothetical protein
MLLVTFLLLSLSSSSSPASHFLVDSSSRSLLSGIYPFFCSLVDFYLDLPFVARHVVIYVAVLTFQLSYVLNYCDFVLEGPLFYSCQSSPTSVLPSEESSLEFFLCS